MANDKPRKKDSARLVWDTKPRRSPNPKDIEFQTAEVVIPNPKTAGELPLSFAPDGWQSQSPGGSLKAAGFGDARPEIDKQKMNRLIWGDNLLAMQALLNQGYEGKINLIYIDPPFDSKADYSHRMTIEGSEFTKEPSVIERLAYKDTWTGGTDSYLDMLYPRLQLMKRLLAEDGNIVVHLDHHVVHYVKIILDEVFSKSNFINEIIWWKGREGGSSRLHSRSSIMPTEYQCLLIFAKDKEKRFWSPPLGPYKQSTISNIEKDDKGWFYTRGRMGRKPAEWELEEGVSLKTYVSENPKESKESLIERLTSPDAKFVNIGDVWDRSLVKDSRVCKYPTEKPEGLIEILIKSATDGGGYVADFFAGSGTTGAVAEKLGRFWIMCELGKVGIQVTRTRLVEQLSKPFLIENIGNYQREMIYLTGGRIWEMQNLILKLYGATPRDKTSGLGIRKIDNVDELVYVGYPDRPVTAKKAEELAMQAQNLDGRGYSRLVILGWDYEYNYSEALESRLHALKAKIKTKIESRDIPPDIYDYLKKAKSEEDIESLSEKVVFYERPYLKLAKPSINKKSNDKIEVKISIDKYVLMDIPVSQSTDKGRDDYAALMKLTKDNFAALIDYWAIDWDYDGFTFKSQWQAFRGNGRKAKTVITTAIETLEKKKDRTVAVRVVDIFGNDAAATIKI
jgi:DNA modification methylase